MRPEESPYVVRLVDIGPDGLQRDYDLAGEFARMALEHTEADADSATLAASLSLAKQHHDVLLEGTLRGAVTLVCSRCLGPARVPVDASIVLLFVPRGHEEDTDPEDPDAPDLIPYDDDRIDLGEMLREEILLALPMAPLCRVTCLGLCATCGKDLNDGACGCAPVVVDERFAQLKSLKIKE